MDHKGFPAMQPDVCLHPWTPSVRWRQHARTVECRPILRICLQGIATHTTPIIVVHLKIPRNLREPIVIVNVVKQVVHVKEVHDRG